MKTYSLKSTLLLLCFFLIPFSTHAYLTSSFDVNIGQSSFIAKAGDDSRTIDSFSAVEMNYSLRNSSLGIAYAITFFELMNSKEGALALSCISLGPRWYPIGMNGNKVLIDNDVVAKIWKATPYLGASLGLTNLSTKIYNASLFNLGMRFGVEIPISPKFLLIAQYVLNQSMSSSSKSIDTEISYTGNSATLGLLISGIGD